jgi:hypothetical protein
MCEEWDCGPDAYSEKWRKARKEHQCCACHETIGAGHRYHYLSGIWEGEPEEFKHCARCWKIYELLVDRAREQGNDVAPSLLLDCGTVWKDPPDEIAALAFVTQGEVVA